MKLISFVNKNNYPELAEKHELHSLQGEVADTLIGCLTGTQANPAYYIKRTLAQTGLQAIVLPGTEMQMFDGPLLQELNQHTHLIYMAVDGEADPQPVLPKM